MSQPGTVMIQVLKFRVLVLEEIAFLESTWQVQAPLDRNIGADDGSLDRSTCCESGRTQLVSQLGLELGGRSLGFVSQLSLKTVTQVSERPSFEGLMGKVAGRWRWPPHTCTPHVHHTQKHQSGEAKRRRGNMWARAQQLCRNVREIGPKE